MHPKTPWTYDEFQQIGKNYTDTQEVALYNQSHALFRDIKRESNNILDSLTPSPDHILIDYGCGTGIFLAEAAKRCKKVYGIDISTTMLQQSDTLLQQQEFTNVHLSHSGFLNFRLSKEKANFAISIFSLHHLPDYWKMIALQNIHDNLADDGILYLKDVVISAKDSQNQIQNFITTQEQLGGDFLKDDATVHFKEEYSTLDWIMEGLLKRSGFVIKQTNSIDNVCYEYYCKKIGN